MNATAWVQTLRYVHNQSTSCAVLNIYNKVHYYICRKRYIVRRLYILNALFPSTQLIGHQGVQQ